MYWIISLIVAGVSWRNSNKHRRHPLNTVKAPKVLTSAVYGVSWPVVGCYKAYKKIKG